LEKDRLLSHFWEARQIAVIDYKNFVRENVGLPLIWAGLRKQVFLRKEMFIGIAVSKIKISKKTGDLSEVPRMQRRAQARSLTWYKEQSLSRNEGIISAYQSGDYLMKQIAESFNVHYSIVSRVVKKAEIDN